MYGYGRNWDFQPAPAYATLHIDFIVVPFGQGYKDMSPPTKELMKLILEERIVHGGYKALR